MCVSTLSSAWRRAKLKVPKAHKSDALSAFPGKEKTKKEKRNEKAAVAAAGWVGEGR